MTFTCFVFFDMFNALSSRSQVPFAAFAPSELPWTRSDPAVSVSSDPYGPRDGSVQQQDLLLRRPGLHHGPAARHLLPSAAEHLPDREPQHLG